MYYAGRHWRWRPERRRHLVVLAWLMGNDSIGGSMVAVCKGGAAVNQKIPIEDVKHGDRVNGQQVVEVLHRYNGYVRLVLEDCSVVDGYRGRTVVQIDKGR